MDGNRTNRFIFSNDFYDNINVPEENNKNKPDIFAPVKRIVDEKPKVNNTETNNSNNDLFNVNPTFNQPLNIQKEDEMVSIKKEEIVEDKVDNNLFNFTPVPNVEPVFTKPENIKIDGVNNISTVETYIEKIPEKMNETQEEFNKDTELNENLGIPRYKLSNEEDLIPNKETIEKESEQLVSINPEPTTDTNQYNNILNVETGVNTELENEIIGKAPVEEKEDYTVPEYDTFFRNDEKPAPYRAQRNVNTIQPIYEEVEKAKDTPIHTLISPQEIMEAHNLGIETPRVINIDEEEKKIVEEESARIESVSRIDYEENSTLPATLSTLIPELKQKELETGNISILANYGEDFCAREYITNPAIGRTDEIKELILILLTPEKSGILVGKPGIGKTSIVEGLAYQLQRNNVPEALKGYRIISVKTTSLFGTLPNGETRLQTLIDELKTLDKIILFIDEVHMLMGATDDSSVDFANMFKESLGRGNIKMIGATTGDEYEKYVLRDKAFVRRFERVDVEEPDRNHTIRILMGTLSKIEKKTGAKLKYNDYVQSEIMSFIVDITSEYKRVYGVGSRYPDICLTLVSEAFSNAVFDNRKEVNIFDIRHAIENSKNIYPDVIKKELPNFDYKFRQLIEEENATDK